MVQTILRRVLLAEVLFYAVLVCLLVGVDASWWKIVGVVALLALLWRLYLTTITHVLARLSSRGSAAHTRDWGGASKALYREFIARLVCFSWSQPFPHLALGSEPCGGPHAAPILLVHGHFSNRGLWLKFRQRLAAAGMGPVYTITLGHYASDLDEFTAQLAARIESICTETSATHVTLIGHSMGGLVCRRYLAIHSCSRIAKLVTLGTPHHGSHYSRWLLGKNARQMRIGSNWLDGLARAEALTEPPSALCLYSRFDEVISPTESGTLAWARNVSITAVGHYGLVFSDVAASEVIRFLAKDESRGQI
ncbi:MAG: alpha/beta fold hydrolase [Betaproteobacteria bacterium]